MSVTPSVMEVTMESEAEGRGAALCKAYAQDSHSHGRAAEVAHVDDVGLPEVDTLSGNEHGTGPPPEAEEARQGRRGEQGRARGMSIAALSVSELQGVGALSDVDIEDALTLTRAEAFTLLPALCPTLTAALIGGAL